MCLSACGQQSTVSFEKDVHPIISKHCVECHLKGGQGFEASGFLVESYDSVMKGTKFGPVIVASDPLSSSLYRLVAGEVDESIRMPHGKDPISEKEIATIERWIEQGAKNN
ncbi:c-type cytochrome domain-containing protein [Imhoffiella purpurea]|uniref:c-type cytochrome domain-containing protein n=1 Tax=Imhoffiella purpurea TaxID=1249627 RepID=UPI001E3E3704|nr:c-type cytochrome domain-containing protein [Imhoffiella purpurea]